MRAVVMALVALLLCVASVRAQNTDVALVDPKLDAEITDNLDNLAALYEAKKFVEVFDGLNAMRKKVEDGAALNLLNLYYYILAKTNRELGNGILELRAALQGVLLAQRTWGGVDLETLDFEIQLAETYDRYSVGGDVARFRVAVQIAATHVLGNVGRLRQAKTFSADLGRIEAVAHGILGKSYARENRPEIALRHFQLLIAHDAAPSSGADLLTQLQPGISSLRSQVASVRSVYETGSCVPARTKTEELIAACQKRADIALLDGQNALAESILRELITDFKANFLTQDRFGAALALHLLLAAERAPDDPALIASVEMTATALAPDDLEAAALLAMRTVRTQVDSDIFNQQLADLCGHIARRAARAGFEDIALRFLDVQLTSVLRGSSTVKGGAALDLFIQAALIKLDAGNFASLNGYSRLVRFHEDSANRMLDVIAKRRTYKELFSDVLRYWDEKRGFVFPAKGAVAEFLGRASLILLDEDDPEREKSLLTWIFSEANDRVNKKSAIIVTDFLIADIRNSGGQEALLAELLFARTSLVDDPLDRARSSREAYEIMSRLPGMEERRIEMLFAMAEESKANDDLDTALKLVDEASAAAVGLTNPSLFLRVEFLNWQGDAAGRAEDYSGRMAAAEEALKLVVENTSGAGISLRIGPAERLATLYAARGRLAEARALFTQHVVNDKLNTPLEIGDAKWLTLRLGYVNLEAFYAPTRQTLSELDDLIRRARSSASRDADLSRSLMRAQAMARYGLGQGLAALLAGREALGMRQSYASEKVREQIDRPLLETLVGAAVLAAVQTNGVSSLR